MNVFDPAFDYTNVSLPVGVPDIDEAVAQIVELTDCSTMWAKNYYTVVCQTRANLPQLIAGMGLDVDSAFIAANVYLDYSVLFITRGSTTKGCAAKIGCSVSEVLQHFNLVALAQMNALLESVEQNIRSIHEEQGLTPNMVLDMTVEELIGDARSLASQFPDGYNPFISAEIYELFYGEEKKDEE